MNEIKLMLVDDHELFRTGLRRLLETEPDITIVGEVGDGWTAQTLVEEVSPDVVLMDLSLPLANGIVATEAIMRKSPDVKVIILTMHEEDHRVSQAIEAGAIGYLLKSASAAELTTAVRSAAAGRSVLDAAVTGKILDRYRQLTKTADASGGPFSLTPKEIEVLGLVGAGLSNSQIAERLGYSQSTIKNRLSVIFSKIGVEDRTQAAIYALTHGLVAQATEVAASA